MNRRRIPALFAIAPLLRRGLRWQEQDDDRREHHDHDDRGDHHDGGAASARVPA